MRMIKAFSVAILLLSLMSFDLSFAQTAPEGVKIYSGYLHHFSSKKNTSFWHTLVGGKPSKQEDILLDKQCSVEFKSSVPFSYRTVAVMPEELTYSVKFKDKVPFEKFEIKIYTKDGEEYPIDPDADGKIFDGYLIYLILGTDIHHLEIVPLSAEEQPDRYVLDKLEVRDNH